MADQEIKISHKFTGKIADPDLAGAGPASGIVNDLSAWQKLWVAWRPNEPIQDVDFKNQIVLISTVPGPNIAIANRLKLDELGDVKYETASTRMGGPGFGYLILVVPKSGIKSVNGISIDGKPVKSNPNQATPTVQTEKRPLTNLQPDRPTTQPGTVSEIDPTLVSQEFIKVEIVGRVRARFRSVSSETTGTLVSADGIVWELDLQDDDQLIEASLRLGNSLALIKGKLRMERQRGGIEAKVRWIVRVESFEALGTQSDIPPAMMPSESPVIRPRNTQPLNSQPIAGDVPLNPNRPNLDNSIPQETTPLVSNPATSKDDPVAAGEEAPMLTSFKKVSIVTSDGQVQSIHSDGLVKYESRARNYANQWTVDPSIIAKLHQFVAETSWDRVPKMTRSNASDPNEISYTVSIETQQNVTRIFIDRAAVPNQPTMKKFFEIIGEMSQK